MGIVGLAESAKCEHERSVHIFTSSLLLRLSHHHHHDHDHDEEVEEEELTRRRSRGLSSGGGVLTGFLCSSAQAFDEGRCVSCSGRRCQGLGQRSLRSARHVSQNPRTLFLRTTSSAPFKVYHYQVRVHLSGHWASVGGSGEVTPSLRLSLHGSLGSAVNLPLNLNGSLVENSTRWFLVDSPHALGDLHRVHLAWHRPPTWTDLWAQLYTLVPWESGSGEEGGQAGRAGPTYLHPQRLMVRKVRVKSAETQIRYAFCTRDYLHVELRPEAEVTLHACPEGWVHKRDVLRMRRLRKR
ncbi:endothelial lipase-like isoform X3 [Petromyzon marinus]